MNPTLFRSPDRYDLHYGSNPYSAFPLFAAGYDPHLPLTSLCLREMESWVRALRAAGPAVSWRFSAGDCLALCGELLPREFAVVSTSNVADHVGLLPLLQAARMVTSPQGHLITSTLLHLSYAADSEDYLQQNLTVGPEMWPGLFGWRCLGFEGGLAPPSSAVAFELPQLLGLIGRLEGGGAPGQKVRSEATFVWTPAPQGNLPLRLSSMPAMQQLVGACRLHPEATSFGDSVPADDRDGLHRLHLPTLLPLLFATRGGLDKVLGPEDREARDLVDFFAGELGLVMAAVPLPSETVRKALDPQPHLAILLDTADHGTLLYTGLWLHGPQQGLSEVRWLVHPDLLAGARVRLVSRAEPLETYTDVRGSPRTPDPRMSAWLRRLQPPPAAQLASGCLEDEEGWQVTLRLSARWEAGIRAGAKWEPPVVGGQGVQIGLAGGAGEAVRLEFPAPVREGIGLSIAKEHRLLVMRVPKGTYPFASRAPPAEFLLDDYQAWQPTRPSPDLLTRWSGMQMDDQERALLKRGTAERPPLLALKETLGVLLQVCDKPQFQLAVGTAQGPDVRALVLHHGLRREHRTGTPAVDVSICFLEPATVEATVRCWQQLLDGGPGCQTVSVSEEELALLREYLQMFAGRAQDASSWEAPPWRAPVPAQVRPLFTRALLPPLFLTEKGLAPMLARMHAARMHAGASP